MTVAIEQAAPHYRCAHEGMRERPYKVAVELRFDIKTVLVDLCHECHRKLKEAKHAE